MSVSGTTQGVRPGVCLSTNRPASPFTGQVIYMSDTDETAVWDGTAWEGLNRSRDRNVVINGAMQVAQRGTSVTGITTGGYRTADRFIFNVGTIGTWTQTVENDAPTGSGFRKSLKVLCTTADASPAAGDNLNVGQYFEGQNLQQFLKGTASAKQFTLSFWVKSNVTGTYIVNLYDNDNTRSVSASYTISASATWEKKTITFPADTTGAFDNDNALSLYAFWWLGAGSNFTSGTLNTTWASATDANRAVGQTNLASATNNYWQITGVQLEAGSVATPFEFEQWDTTYAKCLRYFSMSYAYGTSWPMYPAGYYNYEANSSLDPGGVGGPWFPVPMRTAPTMTLYNAVSNAVGGIYRATDAANITGNSFPRIGNTAAGVIQLGTSNHNNYYYHWTANAEL